MSRKPFSMIRFRAGKQPEEDIKALDEYEMQVKHFSVGYIYLVSADASLILTSGSTEMDQWMIYKFIISLGKLYYPLLAVFCVPVNIVTVLILSRGSCGLTKCVTHYLLSMAAADTLLLIIELMDRYFPILFQKSFVLEHFTEIYKIHDIMLHSTTDCCVWFTVVFTFDQFVAICCHKFKRKYCTEKTAAFALGSVILLSAIKNITWYVMLTDNYRLGYKDWFCCASTNVTETLDSLAAMRLHYILTLVLPFVVILLLHVLIIRHMLLSRTVCKRLQGSSNAQTTHQNRIAENGTDGNESLSNPTGWLDSGNGTSYKTLKLVFVVIVTGSLSLVTIIGNILVICSIKVNKQLQTINNYFIFSLACADLIVGVFSMNLYTIYIVTGYWSMGPVICDLWLAVDYVVSNASAMNLLVISLDRYFCVTKPLSYPLRRTTKRAMMMIATAWMLPFIMFTPPILVWQFITGERNVSDGECYVQFLSNAVVTFGTTIVAFYLPVTIMVILYAHISRASKCQIKDNKKMSESSKDSGCPSLMKDKMKKMDSTSITNVDDGTSPVQEQNGEITNSNCAQEKGPELFNEPTFFSGFPSNQMKQGMMQQRTNLPSEQSCLSKEICKLFCLKIARKSQSYNNSSTNSGIVPTISSENGTGRKVRADDKINTVTKSPANKKAITTREMRVTQTIFAILLAFIITWTPYHVIVFIKTFCSICVPNPVWTIGYWFCYINSTVNPACYALCNHNFKKTFKYLLLCQYRNVGATRRILQTSTALRT
ncbi:muscarinic acetylcholine receptor M2-like [Chiloscyllium plagiosum]|uniref:muscarinic acetylcholine receptor M2-like n=1 Tax=Chiloscyllium plagiosum TaxID=36176 RepID=UPI001CB7EED7|nr:muscarinic acetylcholine receptor M2-like [Chiloscyllium plagiosum]